MTEITSIPEINLYSDGGADPNPGKGGYGVILTFKGHRKELSQGFIRTTNNRMELLGVITGLEQIKPPKARVHVFTDSKYVVDGIEKGWARKWKSNNWYRTKSEKAINPDLWDRLLSLLSKHEVKFHWIRGHNGHPQNERCDQLATMAINSGKLIEDPGFSPAAIALPDEFRKFVEVKSTSRIEKPGDLCRKCSTPVEKKTPLDRKIKPGQTYYFEYVLLCPKCKTIYMVEEAKRKLG